MSKTFSKNVKLWNDLECKLRSQSHYLRTILSEKDVDTWVNSLVTSSLMVYEGLLSVSLEPSMRDISTWLHACCRIHPAILVAECKRIFNHIARYDYDALGNTGDIDALRRFKRVDSKLGVDPLLPVKGAVQRLVVERRWEMFAIISQHLVGFGRVQLDSLDYSKESMTEYLSIEDKVYHHVYPTHILDYMNSIMKVWLRNWTFDGIARHGRGASAMVGKVSIGEKYLNVALDTKLRYAFRDYLDMQTLLLDTDRETKGTPVAFFSMGKVDRTCEVLFVPKSTTTWRTISSEPASLMFFQQAVRQSLYDFFERDHVLRRHIPIYTPEVNVAMAQAGSVQYAEGKGFATLDLSSASDSVSWTLVKRVFKDTKLLRFLLTTRSTHAKLPDGSTIHLEKYAPMGSALCFPVMCLVLAAASETILRLYGKPGKETYSVYGDDIVLPNYLAEPLTRLLVQLGFSVNESKSFSGSKTQFRESCGGEFFKGIDVTPLRLSRKHKYYQGVELITHGAAYLGGIDLINSMLKRNLRLARSFTLQRYLSLPQRYRPLFSDDGRLRSIITNTPTNFHLYSRQEVKSNDLTKPYYQGIEYRCGQVIAKDKTNLYRESQTPFLYFEWLRANADRHVVEEPCVVPRSRRGTMKVVSKRIVIT